MTHPYATGAYAQSLSYWGRPLEVPEWKTWVIVREVEPGIYDAAGTYPIAVLAENADIQGGLERLKSHDLVSVTLVLDDFNRPPVQDLEQSFSVTRPFKSHYIYRRALGELSYGRHHRYELRRALQVVNVDELDLQKNAADWYALYSTLTERHGLTGVHAFPREYHSAMASLDGMKAIGAWVNGELVSCHIWVEFDGHVHSHLAASSALGYSSRAAYGVNNKALEFFGNANVINFGGGAGMASDLSDGLAKFKHGFSNDTAQSYICGAVLDPNRYEELVTRRSINPATTFFPAYRAPV